MPRGDGTGPAGMGPMTGRAAGYCAGYAMPGFANPMVGWGRGFGRGFGRGMGWGRRGGLRGYGWVGPAYPPAYGPAFAPPTAEQERDVLHQQAEALEQSLTDIRTRLAELEAKAKTVK